MHLLNTLPQRLDPGATPTFAGLVAPSLTSPAAIDLTLGTTSYGTALTVASATGNVSIASSTAGSSGAGALVVAGGISAGAASYFGGAVTATETLRVTNGALYTYGESGNATDGLLYFNSQANNYIYGSGSQLAFYTAAMLRATIASTGTTFAGTVIAPAATASLAPLRIPHGTAPTSLTDGDMWTTTAGLFIRINGVTKTVTLT